MEISFISFAETIVPLCQASSLSNNANVAPVRCRNSSNRGYFAVTVNVIQSSTRRFAVWLAVGARRANIQGRSSGHSIVHAHHEERWLTSRCVANIIAIRRPRRRWTRYALYDRSAVYLISSGALWTWTDRWPIKRNYDSSSSLNTCANCPWSAIGDNTMNGVKCERQRKMLERLYFRGFGCRDKLCDLFCV